MKPFLEQLTDLCHETDRSLWEAYACSQGAPSGAPGITRLLFPRYRPAPSSEPQLRVSEQEARFAFVESLCRGRFKYSVETPTDETYSFTGSKEISAQTDLTLLDMGGDRLCNIEFKAKGRSLSAESNFSISKDIQKLRREPVWGMWFHLLESTNNSTITDLLEVMAHEIAQIESAPTKALQSPGLTVHICVLKQGFSIHCDILDFGDIENKLRVGYSVSRTTLLSEYPLNGWSVHRDGTMPA
jgi:hypothetical protein